MTLRDHDLRPAERGLGLAGQVDVPPLGGLELPVEIAYALHERPAMLALTEVVRQIKSWIPNRVEGGVELRLGGSGRLRLGRDVRHHQRRRDRRASAPQRR